MNDYTEKTLKREDIYVGRIITVHSDTVELCNGKTAGREVVDHRGGVSVVPVDGDGNVYLVRQYRYPVGDFLVEIPAGKLEAGEEPLTCAIRELSEETGFTAEKIEFLGQIWPTPGYCGEKLHIYMATGLQPGKTHPDEDEFLDVMKIPLEKAYAMAISGELSDAKTVIGLCRAYAKLK